MQSLIYVDSFGTNDIMIQMSRCSFDIHLQEIMGPMIIGATLVMLHPGGTIDFEYLSAILQKTHITCLPGVPSFFYSFFSFINECNKRDVLKYLRTLCVGGK